MIKQLAAVLLVTVFFSACTPVPVRDDVEPSQSLWEARQKTLSAISQWEVKGRVGVITPEEGWHASLHWKQQDAAYEINLAGPFNQGALRIYGDDKGVSLVVPDKGIVQADTPDALFADNLGWSLPVEAMRYWARGLPTPNLPVTKVIDTQGRLTELHQGEWHVVFARYARVGELDLPAKLVIERPDLKTRLILSSWSLP